MIFDLPRLTLPLLPACQASVRSHEWLWLLKKYSIIYPTFQHFSPFFSMLFERKFVVRPTSLSYWFMIASISSGPNTSIHRHRLSGWMTGVGGVVGSGVWKSPRILPSFCRRVEKLQLVLCRNGNVWNGLANIPAFQLKITYTYSSHTCLRSDLIW